MVFMTPQKQIRRIALLGSTGSIGTATLDVVRRQPDLYSIVSLAAGGNTKLLMEQVLEFSPQTVVVGQARDEAVLRRHFPGLDVRSGSDGVMAAVDRPDADTVVSAITGTVALRATFRAIERGMRICLANKETLVAAGDLINRALDAHQVDLIPVDSEQSAIFQALGGLGTRGVKRLILTASGGPFLDHRSEDLHGVEPRHALAHPRWKMGRKISIDSATLMNKALEMIETQVLFRIPAQAIEVWIHPQSIVHSLVEFDDGSMLAQLGVTDMRLPILYALSHPERIDAGFPRLDLTRCESLAFRAVDHDTFPAIRLAQAVMERGGSAGAVFNAANEVAVEAFLMEKIRFTDIVTVVEETMAASDFPDVSSVAEVEQVIATSKRLADERIQDRSN
jgi:1-deoxy-D-xylulose-5-phosphate reductoisomerase